MRERLTGSFVLLTVLVLVLVVSIRTWRIEELLRDQEEAQQGAPGWA